ncbi:MAG: translation elongation factor Ts [Chloroflexi bacterium RBG_19FT_COMBO_49_13]|nr:MAG: translation elongation factor Ts [Chloroflexi bacterium RBG_13_50_21]OGO61412.1 MAG: translation elongation factor Ts [Chloroflexi bacterium RBG_19FT_COMBO_49_13]
MAIGIEQIKQLREETGAGVLDCRKALETYNGDFEKAIEYLREKGLAKAAKRADREVLEGMVELYSHGNGRVGVMVEVNCETDFVGRSESFRKFAHEVALQVAAGAPKYVRVEDIPTEILEQEREKARNLALAEGKSEKVIERIVDGKMEKYYNDNCLLRQAYVRDENMTVEDLRNQHIAAIGENIVIRRFARWEVGEDTQT